MGAFQSFFQRVAHAIQNFLLFVLRVIAYLPGMIATFFILLWNVLPLVIILALLGIPAVLFAQNQCTVLSELTTILEVNNAAINTVIYGINEALDVLSPLLYINNAFWNFVFQAWDDLFRLLGCTPGQRCQAFEDIVGWFQHCVGFFEEIFLIVYDNIRDLLLGVNFSPLSEDLPEVLSKARDSVNERLDRVRNGTARVQSKVSGNDFVDAVKGFFGFVSNPEVFIEIYNILKFAVEQGIQWITQIFKLLIGEILPAFQWLKDNIFSGFFGNVFVEGFTYMKQTADLVVDFFTTVFPQLLATLANFFASLPGIIANAISSALTGGVGGVSGIVSGALGGIGLSAKRDAMTDAAMFPATPMPAQIEPPAGFAPPAGWDAFARSQVAVRTVPPCSAVLNHFDVYYYASAGPFNRVVLYACAMLHELESGSNSTAAISDLRAKAALYSDRAAAMIPAGAAPLEQRPLFRPASGERRDARRSVRREQAVSLWERVEALASHPGLDDARSAWHRFLKSARTSAPSTPVPVMARDFKPDLNATMSPAAQHFWSFVGTQPSRAEMGDFLLRNRYVAKGANGKVQAKFSFGDVVNPGGISGDFSLPSVNVGDWLDSLYNSIFHCDRSAAPAYYCLPFVNPQPQIGAVDITIHWDSCCAPCQDCSAYQSGWAELHYLLRRLTNSGFISIDKAVRPFFELPVISFLFGWLWNLIVDFTTFGTNGPPANGDFCFGVDIGYLILFFALLLVALVALAAFGMIVAGVLIFAAELLFAVLAFAFYFVWALLTLAFRFVCCCNIPTIEERVETLEDNLGKIKKVLDEDSHRMLTTALQHPRMVQTPYHLVREYVRGEPRASAVGPRPHAA